MALGHDGVEGDLAQVVQQPAQECLMGDLTRQNITSAI